MELVDLKECLDSLKNGDHSFYADIENQMEHLTSVKHITKYQSIKDSLKAAFEECPLTDLTLTLILATEYDGQINVNFSIASENGIPVNNLDKRAALDLLKEKVGDTFSDYDVDNFFSLGVLSEGKTNHIKVDPKQIDNLDHIFLNTGLMGWYRNEKLSVELKENNENTLSRKMKV